MTRGRSGRGLRARRRHRRGLPQLSRAAAVLAFLALAAPASARNLSSVPQLVRDGPTLASASGHFLVHYADPTSAQSAAHIGEVLEAALARETGEWGWPAPLDDGDGKVDVYLFPQVGIEGAANPDPGPRPASGWMQFGADASDLVMAHELLHVLQYAIGVDEPPVYLTEGTAHWAGNRFAGDEGQLVSVPLWANANYLGTPLDCPATSPCHDNAGPATAGWAFFEYLAERFGPQIVADSLHARGRGGAARPAARTLGPVFTDYAIATASGTWKLAPLSMYYPRPSGSLFAGHLAETVTLDHLAAGRHLRPAAVRALQQGAAADGVVAGGPDGRRAGVGAPRLRARPAAEGEREQRDRRRAARRHADAGDARPRQSVGDARRRSDSRSARSSSVGRRRSSGSSRRSSPGAAAHDSRSCRRSPARRPGCA